METHLEFSRVKQESMYRERDSVRHKFATYLLLALEFLIAAEIIATLPARYPSEQ